MVLPAFQPELILRFRMNESRNNHYVPQWYQEGFFEPDKTTLAYLDLEPPRHALPDGRLALGRSKFNSPTSRCFVERDLYSTFFKAAVSDEIERKLFGSIDAEGSLAVKAFAASDPQEWHKHFQTLFRYIDIQKIRTPKGLAWLKAQYPDLDQNELMWEMQGIQMMHCTIWAEGVREIVSAETSDVKFITTDHPVTIYNPAVAPSDSGCSYPNDPPIAFKASQTLFPLNRDFCLILTNLEYAKNPAVKPLEKRTFARNYRNSMVRTDAFIRTRKLASPEVRQINYILKTRAHRYIAAGREEWLYPERQATGRWRDLVSLLRPPEDGLWRFGGEMFARFEDGRVHYQDQFGRTEKPIKALQRPVPAMLRPGETCGCGSDQPYRDCCQGRPVDRRPSWSELSIRKRNLALYRAAADILGVEAGKDWIEIRQALTDEKISRLYSVFQTLWPLETDLLKLLPKPDGRARAVYTGPVHPDLIQDFALAAGLYIGEVLIEHPFVHAGAVQADFSPVEHPENYRQEVLKAVVLLFTLMPLIACGLVNLVPNPADFDLHLRDQVMRMASDRTAGFDMRRISDPRLDGLMQAELRRSRMMMPSQALKAKLAKGVPGLEGVSVEEMLGAVELAKLHDPLMTLHPDPLGGGDAGGQMLMMKLAPNFEMAMYLAQATGACIVTDSPHRWFEVNAALFRRRADAQAGLRDLAVEIAQRQFLFPQDEDHIAELWLNGGLSAYPQLIAEAQRYLSDRHGRGPKPNFEAQLAARFRKVHSTAQGVLSRSGRLCRKVRVRVAFPEKGIQDNTINRLLLMSSAEHYLASVPMAFSLEKAG